MSRVACIGVHAFGNITTSILGLTFHNSHSDWGRGSAQRLIQIDDQVIGIFQSHRQAHQTGRRVRVRAFG